MSVTAIWVYSQVADVLLEPGQLLLGIYTEAQFLSALGTVLLDFSQRAALDKFIYTQRIVSGTSDYTIPDVLMEPELCFVGGRLIEKVSEEDLGNFTFQWKNRTGPPQKWHEDNLDVKHLQVSPTPDYSGTNNAPRYGDFYPTERNLTVVGPAAPSKVAWALLDTIDGIPDSFACYLVYGVLEQVFTSDSEMRDQQRAAYCHARYEEGIELARVIAQQELMVEED